MKAETEEKSMLMLYLTYIDDENDKNKFEKMYHSYKKQMVFLAMSILHNEDKAEDVVGDVFLRIAQKQWDTVRDIKSDKDLRNYLLKAAKNEAMNLKKAEKRAPLTFDEAAEQGLKDIEELSDDTFVETVCNKVEYEQVMRAMESLDEKYRWTLYYHLVMELSVKETAKALNQPIETTRKQLTRGKKMLRKILE